MHTSVLDTFPKHPIYFDTSDPRVKRTQQHSAKILIFGMCIFLRPDRSWNSIRIHIVIVV